MSLKFCNSQTPMVVSDLKSGNMASREMAKFCEATGLAGSGRGFVVIPYDKISEVKSTLKETEQ